MRHFFFCSGAFYISVILQAGCNGIESNIANCRMSRGEKSMKKVKIKTQNEKTIEANMYIWH